MAGVTNEDGKGVKGNHRLSVWVAGTGFHTDRLPRQSLKLPNPYWIEPRRETEAPVPASAFSRPWVLSTTCLTGRSVNTLMYPFGYEWGVHKGPPRQ